MNWPTESLRVFQKELTLFTRFPKLRLAVAGIAVIPALYAWIYLVSVWDPASRTSLLPALIVNSDRGVSVDGKQYEIGSDLVRSLHSKNAFSFSEVSSEEDAKQQVRTGRALFALLIPAGFSEGAIAATEVGSGRLTIYASEGNNYTGSGFAKRFAAELGHQMNETLNERRWAAVLGATSSSADSLARLKEGVSKLQRGAGQLAEGAGHAADGSERLATGAKKVTESVDGLTEGVKLLGAAVHQLDARKPSSVDLQSLKTGAMQLSKGVSDVAMAMPKLESGASQLAEGAGKLRDQSKSIPIAGAKVSDAAARIADGASTLVTGLHTANDAQQKLAAGSQKLATGVAEITEGFTAYSGAVSTIASKLPQDERLDELSAGTRTLAKSTSELSAGLTKLQAGSGLLASGLKTLAESLPAEAPTLKGTSAGLANSVQPIVEIDAPVANNGLGFTPNFVPVSLWLGAVMTAFVFHLRRLPSEVIGVNRVSLLLGKMALLGSVNIVQTLLVFAMCWILLGLHPVHAGGLVAAMIASSLTFMLVILALVRLLGDAGKVMALILLIVQLSSAGGVMPIELTNDFYGAISPWLPFTWSVKAVRASAFGAFADEWVVSVGVICVFGAIAFMVALVAGRWNFVSGEEHRPAVDV